MKRYVVLRTLGANRGVSVSVQAVDPSEGMGHSKGILVENLLFLQTDEVADKLLELLEEDGGYTIYDQRKSKR